MSDYLPPTVLANILSRLPVKSLLRFRCVCKSWKTLISTPNFITTHSHHSHTAPRLLIKYFSPTSQREHYTLFFDNNNKTLKESQQLKCPFKSSALKFFRLVSICNGLICLSDDLFSYTYTIILWNPAIRRSLTLPMPRVCFDSYGPYMFALGFGFDPNTNDYKVVRIAYLTSGGSGYVAPPEVEVFTLSTGLWKDIETGVVPPYNMMIEYFWSSVFVNGVIHWLAYQREGRNRPFRNLIMGFDVGAEVFRDLDLPEGLAHEYPLKLAIGVCEEDSISIFQYDDREESSRCSIWVMKQYGVTQSWSKLFNVELSCLGTVLGFKKNGQVLLAKSDGALISYNPKNKSVKKLMIRGGRNSVYMGPFAESLVLLDGGPLVNLDASTTDEEPVSHAGERAVLAALNKHFFMHYTFAVAFIGY